MMDELTPSNRPMALDDDGVESARPDAPPGLFLSRRGAWYHDGDRVKHPRLEGLLNQSIARAPDGTLLVTTGIDRLSFVAEDAPYFIRSFLIDNDLRVTLSDGSKETAHSVLIDDDGRVRSPVKNGAFWALWSRSACQALTALVDENANIVTPSRVLSLTSTRALRWAEPPLGISEPPA